MLTETLNVSLDYKKDSPISHNHLIITGPDHTRHCTHTHDLNWS